MKATKSVPNFFVNDDLLTVLSQVAKQYCIDKGEFVEAAVARELNAVFGITGFEKMCKPVSCKVSTLHHKGDDFEVVSECPDGYFVWNIGRSNFPFERMLPLAKHDETAEDWEYRVDTKSLKALEVASEELALKILKEAGRKEVGAVALSSMLSAAV